MRVICRLYHEVKGCFARAFPDSLAKDCVVNVNSKKVASPVHSRRVAQQVERSTGYYDAKLLSGFGEKGKCVGGIGQKFRVRPVHTFSTRKELRIQSRRLRALIFHHKIKLTVSGEMVYWTYISQGLNIVGQKEIVFTVRRRINAKGEWDYPKDPL